MADSNAPKNNHNEDSVPGAIKTFGLEIDKPTVCSLSRSPAASINYHALTAGFKAQAQVETIELKLRLEDIRRFQVVGRPKHHNLTINIPSIPLGFM